MDLSVVIPLYDEEESIRPLYAALCNALRRLGMDYEILLVDDGSRDGTFRTASSLARSDPRLRIIRLRRNYGQTPAMMAGIDNARGAVIVTMDGDLQNDPADIAMFLNRIGEGYDIVLGWRQERQDKLFSRKIPSKIANWLIGKVTGVPVRDNGCSLKAYRAHLIKNIPLYSEMHRFIPAMASMTGSRMVEVKVRHHARQFGVSKYGLSRTYKVLIDLIAVKTVASFAGRPLMLFSILAILPTFLSSVLLAVSVYKMFVQSAVMPISLTAIGILCAALSGFLILGGILAELVNKTGNIKPAHFSLLTMQRG